MSYSEPFKRQDVVAALGTPDLAKKYEAFKRDWAKRNSRQREDLDSDLIKELDNVVARKGKFHGELSRKHFRALLDEVFPEPE
ncbi:hypothetical protein ACGFX8_34430 [Streptomyces sp. NPDC048362]|uniref:hypothetical protein n=1 Tax=Streptomyces sp. NPDC048362 TaxID=3365539 RepID=UPI00371A9A75